MHAAGGFFHGCRTIRGSRTCDAAADVARCGFSDWSIACNLPFRPATCVGDGLKLALLAGTVCGPRSKRVRAIRFVSAMGEVARCGRMAFFFFLQVGREKSQEDRRVR